MVNDMRVCLNVTEKGLQLQDGSESYESLCPEGGRQVGAAVEGLYMTSQKSVVRY